MRVVYLLLLTIVPLGGCGARPPGSDALVAQELQKLSGTWTAFSYEERQSFSKTFLPYHLAFDGDKVKESKRGDVRDAIVQLDLKADSINIEFEFPNGTARWGRYVVESDVLIIHWAVGKNTEPTSGQYVKLELRRDSAASK